MGRVGGLHLAFPHPPTGSIPRQAAQSLQQLPPLAAIKGNRGGWDSTQHRAAAAPEFPRLGSTC